MSCSSCQGLYTGSTPCGVCNCTSELPPTPVPVCEDPNAEPCADAVDSQCVIYSGDSLPCIGVDTSNGPIRYDDIIAAINNAMCQAAIGTTFIQASPGSETCITITGTGSQGDPIIIGLNLDSGITCGPNGLVVDSGITLEPHSGLVWDPTGSNNLSTLYDTEETGDSVELQYNGGSIPSMDANTWNQMTLVQVLDAILFPLRTPEYIEPTISLSATGMVDDQLYEAGTVLNISFTPTARNNDAGGFTLLEVFKNTYTVPNTVCTDSASFASVSVPATAGYGVDDTYVPLLPSGSTGTTGTSPNFDWLSSPACSVSTFTVPTSFSGTMSTTKWYPRGTYVDGPKKKKSDGTLDTNFIPAGVITGDYISVRGVYPIFYGIIDSASAPTASNIVAAIQTLTPGLTSKKVINANENIAVDYCLEFNTNNNIVDRWMWVAIPTPNTLKTKVYTEWDGFLITIDNANAWVNLNTVTSIDVPGSVGSSWAHKDYIIYRTKTSTNANPGITEFRNS